MKRIPALIVTVITACWIAAYTVPASAQDYRIVSYQNSMNRLVSEWAAAEITLAGKIMPVLQELEQKQGISSPSDADKARIAELIKQRDDLRAQMDAESNNLKVEMMLMEVQPGA
ncbi:MAG TPA: hypothetical protein VGG57_11760, partial [Stellaceae bacterium]